MEVLSAKWNSPLCIRNKVSVHIYIYHVFLQKSLYYEEIQAGNRGKVSDSWQCQQQPEWKEKATLSYQPFILPVIHTQKKCHRYRLEEVRMKGTSREAENLLGFRLLANTGLTWIVTEKQRPHKICFLLVSVQFYWAHKNQPTDQFPLSHTSLLSI